MKRTRRVLLLIATSLTLGLIASSSMPAQATNQAQEVQATTTAMTPLVLDRVVIQDVQEAQAAATQVEALVQPAAAKAPKSCTKRTGTWWRVSVDAETPLYHFVILYKESGTSAYICIGLAADRKPKGGHKSVLEVQKPGKDIKLTSTKKWSLITPKPFKLKNGQEFTMIARVTVKDPVTKSGKRTVVRIFDGAWAAGEGPVA